MSQIVYNFSLNYIYISVEIYEGSKDVTAFVAQELKSYRFEVLPFGLCTAPNTFQALADRVFEGMKWKSILIYLDDVIIFSKTPKEHLEKLGGRGRGMRKAKGSRINAKSQKMRIFEKGCENIRPRSNRDRHFPR